MWPFVWLLSWIFSKIRHVLTQQRNHPDSNYTRSRPLNPLWETSLTAFLPHGTFPINFQSYLIFKSMPGSCATESICQSTTEAYPWLQEWAEDKGMTPFNIFFRSKLFWLSFMIGNRSFESICWDRFRWLAETGPIGLSLGWPDSWPLCRSLSAVQLKTHGHGEDPPPHVHRAETWSRVPQAKELQGDTEQILGASREKPAPWFWTSGTQNSWE